MSQVNQAETINERIKSKIVSSLGLVVGGLAGILYLIDIFIPIVSYGPFFSVLLSLLLVILFEVGKFVIKYGSISFISLDQLIKKSGS